MIADYACEWSDTNGQVCQQHGTPPPAIKTILLKQMRRLGQPPDEDRRTYFIVWKAKSAGWTLVAGFHFRMLGADPRLADEVTLCQVIAVVDEQSRVTVLRRMRFQKVYWDKNDSVSWMPLDIADADGDGRPEIILRGDAYEDHWFEVVAVQPQASKMVFAGLGYYL